MLYRRLLLAMAATEFCTFMPVVAHAQSTETLEADTAAIVAKLSSEIGSQQDEAGALKNAQNHIADGDLLMAAGILEGYLMVDQEAVSARVEYAALLCQLDDHQAAEFELAKLATMKIGETQRERLVSSCGVSPEQVIL